MKLCEREMHFQNDGTKSAKIRNIRCCLFILICFRGFTLGFCDSFSSCLCFLLTVLVISKFFSKNSEISLVEPQFFLGQRLIIRTSGTLEGNSSRFLPRRQPKVVSFVYQKRVWPWLTREIRCHKRNRFILQHFSQRLNRPWWHLYTTQNSAPCMPSTMCA